MESDVQKMRSAARHLLNVIDEMGFKPWCAGDALALACDKLDSTLTLPLRNCDVGTAEEQIARYGEFCQRECLSCDKRISCHMRGESYRMNCMMKWAQMPYESEVKDGN